MAKFKSLENPWAFRFALGSFIFGAAALILQGVSNTQSGDTQRDMQMAAFGAATISFFLGLGSVGAHAKYKNSPSYQPLMTSAKEKEPLEFVDDQAITAKNYKRVKPEISEVNKTNRNLKLFITTQEPRASVGMVFGEFNTPPLKSTASHFIAYVRSPGYKVLGYYPLNATKDQAFIDYLTQLKESTDL